MDDLIRYNVFTVTPKEDQTIIIIASVLGAFLLALAVAVAVLCVFVCKLRRQPIGPRVQKVSVSADNRNHAFHNPAISPDEELSKRGYSMYVANEDVESGRGTERYNNIEARNQDIRVTTPTPEINERQTGGQFVDELTRELEHRHQRQERRQEAQSRQERERQPEQRNTAPPFLLNSIESNKSKSKELANPIANNSNLHRSNSNFIY